MSEPESSYGRGDEEEKDEDDIDETVSTLSCD